MKKPQSAPVWNQNPGVRKRLISTYRYFSP
uniref:Uncharacterized protein n=1 Tax=Myoviridae sp. ct5ra14 TaxID=2827659 RepID=A0A8S5T1K6_9CAUD|nr:MAG TPA: hypothetical protein [Myoviridae sp. ct5ra14]DAY79636.1 MAG TPA: hypothetical protein [Caudoviricetes sp.]